MSAVGPILVLFVVFICSGPKVIKLFSYSTQLSMKFSLLTIAGIFIFISREIFVRSYA